jgi:hypothetical protein
MSRTQSPGALPARTRTAATEGLQPGAGSLLTVAIGPYVGEAFDCPASDTPFLGPPNSYKAPSRPLSPCSPATMVGV